MHSATWPEFVVVIEDRVIEVLLGGEVAEDDGFGDAGGGGDFLGGGAAEALPREEIERGFEELAAAVAGGKAESGGTGVGHSKHCKSVLTYSQAQGRFSWVPLGSLGSCEDRILL